MRYPINIIPKPNKVEQLDGLFIIPPHSAPEDYTSRVLDSRIQDEEGYCVTVRISGITVYASTKKGMFYGMQTVRQLAATNLESIPCVKIEDSPAYPYRAFMVDCARHMVSVENLKKLIEAAALLKMNVFHWHLTDDQGWRFESEKYPRLNTVSAFRKSSDFGGHHVRSVYGGVYSKAQMQEIVEYCAERFIEVIPEFDMPGHNRALLAAYPELSCRGEAKPVETRQGIFKDILCAGKEETFKTVFNILDEIMDVFPGRYIHIGGDEAPKERWDNCHLCKKRMAEEKLQSSEQLQGWFTNKVIAYLKEHGRKAIVWNESLKSGMLDNSAVAQLWMDKNNDCAHWANSGGRIIVSDYYSYYCDYPYGMTPLKKTYKFNPHLPDIIPERRKYIMGVEAPIWTEHVSRFDHLCYMCFPRFAAVAETGWTSIERKEERGFENRFIRLTPLLKSMGIEPAPVSEWNPGKIQGAKDTADFFVRHPLPKPFRK